MASAVASTTQALRRLVVWQDPDRMSGAPCFAGTRVPIKILFDYLEAGDSLNQFLDDFAGVTREQALGALRLGKEEFSFRQGWQEAQQGHSLPVSTLWDGIDAE